jgi:ketosteroid isomerase-like protein
MRTTAPCPTDLAVEQYLLRELGEGASALADHIGACDACQKKVAVKRADDAVFQHSPAAIAVRRVLSSVDDKVGEQERHARTPRRAIAAGLVLAAAVAVSIAVANRRPSDSPPSSGADTSEEAVVLRVQREWMEAVRDKDVAALDHILADDYTYTDSRGRVSTKADSLRQARATGGRMKAFHTSEAKALVHGDVAVVTGRVRIEGEAGGEPYDAEVRFTDVLARIDGRWRAIAAHASQLNGR